MQRTLDELSPRTPDCFTARRALSICKLTRWAAVASVSVHLVQRLDLAPRTKDAGVDSVRPPAWKILTCSTFESGTWMWVTLISRILAFSSKFAYRARPTLVRGLSKHLIATGAATHRLAWPVPHSSRYVPNRTLFVRACCTLLGTDLPSWARDTATVAVRLLERTPCTKHALGERTCATRAVQHQSRAVVPGSTRQCS